MKIRKRHFRPSLRRIITFAGAFIFVKIIKPYIDHYRGRDPNEQNSYLLASKSLSKNQQFVQIGKGDAFSKAEPEPGGAPGGAPEGAPELTFEDEWNQLESEAKKLEQDLAALPKPDINTVQQQQQFEKDFGAKVPLGLPPALFIPPSQGGVQGLSLDEQQQILARQQQLAQAAIDANPFAQATEKNKPLGKPGSAKEDLAELYSMFEVNFEVFLPHVF